MEEEISRTLGAVSIDHQDDSNDDEISDSVLLDIGLMSQRMIASVKVHSEPRQASQVEVQDVPQVTTFQSKSRHSSISPEDLSERWQIGIETAKQTLKRTSQRLV